jgi:sugar diacid utilization regulator
LAGEGEDGREAALILARPLIGYVDVFSHVVNAAFAEAEEAISASTSAVRGELTDVLLSGGELTPGPQLNLARQTGLDFSRSLAVIVARTVPPMADEATLGIAAVALARAMGDAIEPLAVVRGGEVVVVRSTAEPEAHALSQALRTTWQRLQERGIELAVGVSTVHDGLAEVPTAYREACLVVEQLPERGGALGLADLSVADYLLFRADDDTAWRLVPPEVRSFVEDDARQGGVLCDTLLAYVACDLNVKLAAEQLFVHPNTAHYRLARIEERTGCSTRSLRDVLLLTIAIRLQRRR